MVVVRAVVDYAWPSELMVADGGSALSLLFKLLTGRCRAGRRHLVKALDLGTTPVSCSLTKSMFVACVRRASSQASRNR